MNRMPHAIAGRTETMILAIAKILVQPNWWDIPEEQFIGMAMVYSHGAADPKYIKAVRFTLVSERGLL